MSAAEKLLKASAGNAGGAAVYVDDVFSTHTYIGTGSSLAINNGIDLSGKGGLIWTKRRDNSARTNILVDTARGATKVLNSDGTYNEYTMSNMPSSFNSDGYTIGASDAGVNASGDSYVSWTFRKQAGFFDVQTWSGNSTAGRTISHDLGSIPAMIIIKNITTNGEPWYVYHRSLDSSAPEDYHVKLNSDAARVDSDEAMNDTAPTATHFSVSQYNSVNGSGKDYVAYLFAHDDQSFGENSDEAIIKCGSYTGTGSYTNPPVIDLGFEPQWVMIKEVTGSGDWLIADVMRAATSQIIGTRGEGQILKANSSATEVAYSGGYIPVSPTATGFTMSIDGSEGNSNGNTYLYVAIRRSNKPASEFAATELFKPNNNDNGGGRPDITSGFPVDFYFRRYRNTDGHGQLLSRLGGRGILSTSTSDAESTTSYNSAGFDYNDGVMNIFSATNSNYGVWMWRRAVGYMDVVCYKGSSSTYLYNHNLGVAPEMMWVKNRNAAETSWSVYHSALGADYRLQLNSNGASSATSDWDNASDVGTAPTATQFNVKAASVIVNHASYNYAAFLFASVDGISKVGSYTGTGSNVTVDCGFSAGSRFVLIKRTDSTGDWYYWDSVRGIVAGNDTYLLLNSAAAEVTNTDYIDPSNGGFIVTSSAPAALNASGGTYIFYAIA